MWIARLAFERLEGRKNPENCRQPGKTAASPEILSPARFLKEFQNNSNSVQNFKLPNS
jgi:hypothetical protein